LKKLKSVWNALGNCFWYQNKREILHSAALTLITHIRSVAGVCSTSTCAETIDMLHSMPGTSAGGQACEITWRSVICRRTYDTTSGNAVPMPVQAHLREEHDLPGDLKVISQNGLSVPLRWKKHPPHKTQLRCFHACLTLTAKP